MPRHTSRQCVQRSVILQMSINRRGERMSLRETLRVMSKNNTVPELNRMLGENNQQATVSISWSCHRLVSIRSFPDKQPVDINLLVNKYLSARPKCSDGIKNLKERLDFYHLWIKMKKLCEDNGNTWLYRFVLPLKEFCNESRYCRKGATPRNYIMWADKDSDVPSINSWCFSFFSNDFKKLWPNQEPNEICDFEPLTSSYSLQKIWIATPEMVDQAYKHALLDMYKKVQ